MGIISTWFIVLQFILLIFVVRISSQDTLKPNIIIIAADDLGWNDVSFHGSNQVPTPNIDALAYSGVILNNYYSMPVCTPARSALLTGRHPIHLGLQHYVILPEEPWGLGLEEKLLPEYLKEQGYATHMIGKWHLGYYKKEYTPTLRGFDSFFGFWGSHKDYTDFTMRNAYWGYDMRENLNVTYRGIGEYITRLFSDEAKRVIHEHNASEPFFLYLSHLAVHIANIYQPLEAPLGTIARFMHIKDPRRRVFAAMLTELDHSVGVVIAALAERGLLENSIILFTSDNGGSAGGYRYSAASNWPLRGTKNSLWDGALRVPTVVWSPLLQNTPRVSEQLIHVQDWLPTLMAAIGVNISMNNIDGLNVWPALNDPEIHTHDEILLNIDDVGDTYALKMGDWKIIKGGGPASGLNQVFGPTGREGSYDVDAVKYSDVALALDSIGQPLPVSVRILQLRNASTLTCQEEGEWTCRAPEGETCLFNIRNDPCEFKDLAASEPLILNTMLKLLDAYNATAVAVRNQPLDPKSDPKLYNYTWTTWCDDSPLDL